MLEAFRPLRTWLVSPLAVTFRDRARPDAERFIATSILAEYAADDPARLADLLMSAEAKQYARLFSAAEKTGAKVSPFLQSELEKRAVFEWNDPPLEASWAGPDPGWKSLVESAHGFLDDHFIFFQTMPLDEATSLAQGLRKAGYRPVRFRPYADGGVVRVAAAWTRDGRSWRMASGLTRDEIEQRDEANRAEKFFPVDAAGYMAAGIDRKPADRFAAVWLESSLAEDDGQLRAGLTAGEYPETRRLLLAAGFMSVTVQGSQGADGHNRYCAVWRKVETSGIPMPLLDVSEGNLSGWLPGNAWATLIDLAVAPGPAPPRGPRTCRRPSEGNRSGHQSQPRGPAGSISSRHRQL